MALALCLTTINPAQAHSRLEAMTVGAQVEDSCTIVALWDHQMNLNLQCSDRVLPMVEERTIGPVVASLPGTVLTVVTW